MKNIKELLGLAVAATFFGIVAITNNTHDGLPHLAGIQTGNTEATLSDVEVSAVANASAEQLATRVQELARETPDSPENRDRIFSEVNSALMMATLSQGMPPSSAPTVESVTRDYYEKTFIKQKADMQAVADWLRLERQMRAEKAKNGQDAESSNYTAALLLPYLEEAGFVAARSFPRRARSAATSIVHPVARRSKATSSATRVLIRCC